MGEETKVMILCDPNAISDQTTALASLVRRKKKKMFELSSANGADADSEKGCGSSRQRRSLHECRKERNLLDIAESKEGESRS